jgi:hypothetical protein
MKISQRVAGKGEVQPVWRKSLLSPVQLIWLHEADRNIQLVPVSENMIQRRIKGCAANILYEWFARIMWSEILHLN